MSNGAKTVPVALGSTVTILVLCAMMLMSCQDSQETSSAPAENIALGKSCKLTPTPQYWLGDPPTPRVPHSRKAWEDTDAAVLVDGIHGSDQKWAQPATPCWAHASRPQITIDLGQVHNIDRVSFYAAGGGAAGVYFPVIAAVLVSEDGTDYYLFGTVHSLGLAQRGQPDVQKFEVSDSPIRGRYVQLIFQSGPAYTCIEEVEVFAAASVSAGPTSGQQPIAITEVNKLLDQAVKARWVVSEWLDVKNQIQSMIEAKQTSLATELLQEVQALDQQLAHLDVSKEEKLAAFRAKFLDLRTKAASPIFGKELITWQVNPWANLRGSAFPRPDASAPQEISLAMWQDEYESAAFGITNLKSQPMSVKVKMSPLQSEDGQLHSWTDRLWLREALAVPVRQAIGCWMPCLWPVERPTIWLR